MSNLSKQSYKGTRDYYPEDKRLQNYIFEIWRTTVESFGYEEYGAPILEPLELYAAKSGADLVNDETYRFVDRGDREVSIRPEMTPTVARMVAARQQEIAYPARWYSIANFMRYERPQSGREREFWQLNIDLFGVDSIYADAEIITISDRVLKAFGASEEMYTIKVNHRRLIDFMMKDFLGLDVVQSQLMIKLFDKKNKMPPQDFKDKVIDIFEPEQVDAGLQKIAKLLSAQKIEDLPVELRDNPIFAEITTLFQRLKHSKVNSIQFDVTLMRGLDYYNGMVFEVFDNNPDNKRSMFGGGRYDGMTALFGAENIPVVGVAPGATTTEVFLRAHKLLPEISSRTDLYTIVLGDNLGIAPQKIVDKLRDEGMRVELDITDRKTDKKIKTAVKKKIPFLLFIGEDEIKNEIYTLKEVATGQEYKISLERLVTMVMGARSHKEDDDF